MVYQFISIILKILITAKNDDRLWLIIIQRIFVINAMTCEVIV